jgi:hypothetical protein
VLGFEDLGSRIGHGNGGRKRRERPRIAERQHDRKASKEGGIRIDSVNRKSSWGGIPGKSAAGA